MTGTQGLALGGADERASAQSTTSGAAPSSRLSRAGAMSLLLLLALALPLIPSYFEWKHFRQDLNMLDARGWTFRDLPLLWLWYVKTQIVLLPALLLAMLLIRFRWWRPAILLFVASCAAVFAWVQVDLKVYALTNVHVLSYLDFVGDPGATQWGGDPWDNVADAARNLKRLFMLSGIVMMGIVLFVELARRFALALISPRAAWLLAVLYAVALVGVWPAQATFRDRHTLQRAHAMLPFDMTWTAAGLNLVDTSAFATPFNEALMPGLKRNLSVLFNHQRQDQSAGVLTGPRPHVLLLVVESLREDAMTDEVMPHMSELSRRGMRLSQHFAAARYSHLGMFNLLFGRTSSIYYIMLQGTTHPQACITLKNCGYHTTYTASADHLAWVRMGRFINDETFDQMNLFHAKSWITRDQRTIGRVQEVLDTAPKDQPQFITAFVAATHYPYICPKEDEVFKPALPEDFRFIRLRPDSDMLKLHNRYMNSCHYMDRQLADLIAKIDLSKTLVIVTGDHGESLFDDGALAHGGRWSNSQLRVPCFFVGAGVEPHIVTDATTHADILPTLLHVVAGRKMPLSTITGRDVLAGDPVPDFHVVGSNSLKDRFELLVSHNDRRMLFGFSITRFEARVQGSVDKTGNVDPFDLPSASEAAEWAKGVEGVFAQLTGQP